MTGEPLSMGIAELAAYLGVPKQTVYRWRKYGGGPRGYRLGKVVRFRESEVERWLEQQHEKAS